MKKFPKIKRLEQTETITDGETGSIVVQEKLDGANGRFTITDAGEILFGTRRTEFKEDSEPLPIQKCNKQFRHALQYLHNFLVAKPAFSDYTFFGECLHTHSINYDAWDGKHPDPSTKYPPNFIVFDIWDERSGNWLTPNAVATVSEQINLVYVGEIQRLQLPVSELDIEIPQSQFREKDKQAETEFDELGLAEGVVIKNTATNTRAKVVHDTFKEVKTFSQQSSEPEFNEFVERFVTQGRVKKQAHKLRNQYEYDQITMEMMEQLPQAVIKDVLVEEGWNIICDEYGIVIDEDAKAEIREQTSKKCSRILHELL